MSILPIIEEFIKEKKIDQVLLTSITVSSGSILEKRYSQNPKVIHQFLPLDIPILIKKFLNHWKPNLTIFIDSEIWPNLIFEIHNNEIPLLLINGRITEKTFKRWRLVINFARKIFSKFDLCIASNKESEKFLQILGASKTKNYGNLKFSQTKTSSNKELDASFLKKIKNRKIWCAASTHADEEILCAETHLKIKKNYNNVLTIIIPRHINRAKQIITAISKLNLNVALYSESDQIGRDTDILIIDSYGESLKFYNISKNVFIGKSLVETLVKDSGQNPIEAARQGCKVFHGPNIRNFVEIYDYLQTLDVTKEVKNSDDLCSFLINEFKQERSKNDETIRKIENYGQNIFNNVILEIKKYIYK